MASQQNSPVTVNSGGTGTAWTRPDLARGSDNSYAYCSIPSLGQTAELRATGFNFSIPIASTIDGVVVSIERKASIGSSIRDYQVGLLSAGIPAGGTVYNDLAYWGTTDATQSYGSPGDLWSLSLTPAFINSTGFGAYLIVQSESYSSIIAYVDHIQITVYYTLSGLEYGTTNVGDIYYGTTKIQKVYHGTTEVI